VETMTLERYRETIKPKKRSKFGNVITHVDGHKFDSKAEARRYQQLILLQRAGVISGLELQPPFELQAKFRGADGKMVRAITYIADFQYNENGRVVVEDVKGKLTDVFRIKKKLFNEVYPHLELRLTK